MKDFYYCLRPLRNGGIWQKQIKSMESSRKKGKKIFDSHSMHYRSNCCHDVNTATKYCTSLQKHVPNNRSKWTHTKGDKNRLVRRRKANKNGTWTSASTKQQWVARCMCTSVWYSLAAIRMKEKQTNRTNANQLQNRIITMMMTITFLIIQYWFFMFHNK